MHQVEYGADVPEHSSLSPKLVISSSSLLSSALTFSALLAAPLLFSPLFSSSLRSLDVPHEGSKERHDGRLHPPLLNRRSDAGDTRAGQAGVAGEEEAGGDGGDHG